MTWVYFFTLKTLQLGYIKSIKWKTCFKIFLQIMQTVNLVSR